MPAYSHAATNAWRNKSCAPISLPFQIGSSSRGRGECALPLRCSGAKSCRAVWARANGPKVIVREDAGIVPVSKVKLNGVSTYGIGRLRLRLWLEHRQRRRRCKGRVAPGEVFFLRAFVIAGRARTLVAQVRKVVMRVMAIRPSNVEASARRNVNLDVGWFLALVDGSRHENRVNSSNHRLSSTGYRQPRRKETADSPSGPSQRRIRLREYATGSPGSGRCPWAADLLRDGKTVRKQRLS